MFLKKFRGPNLGQQSGPNLVFFPHFLKLGSLVILEIAYNDSLQQCLTSSRGGKIRPKIRFFVIFSSLVH